MLWLDPVYKSYESLEIIWGHRGQKVIFIKNAITRPCSKTINFNMCISLRPSTYVMESKSTWGHFGVTGVKSWFSRKMLTRPLTLWKFVAENHTENFAALRITLKNNIKEVLLKITLKRGLCCSGMQKKKKKKKKKKKRLTYHIFIQTKYHFKS